MSQNLHKIFKQIFELPNDEAYQIGELIESLREARTSFENVGKEFTYDNFKEYFKRYHSYNLQKNPSYALPMLKIIEGDNLDTIEDAAVEKGILPKEIL